MGMRNYNTGMVRTTNPEELDSFIDEFEYEVDCCIEQDDISVQERFIDNKKVKFFQVYIMFESSGLPTELFNKYSKNENFLIKGCNRFEGSNIYSIFKSENGKTEVISESGFRY